MTPLLSTSLRFLACLVPVTGALAVIAGIVVSRTWGDAALAAFGWGALL
jgi:hypothetical protein